MTPRNGGEAHKHVLSGCACIRCTPLSLAPAAGALRPIISPLVSTVLLVKDQNGFPNSHFEHAVRLNALGAEEHLKDFHLTTPPCELDLVEPIRFQSDAGPYI